MKVANWVVGGGGLLGSGLLRGLKARGADVRFGPRVRWGTTSALDDLSLGLSGVINRVDPQAWQVFWCAGVGVTGSSREEFLTEVSLFESFLELIRSLPDDVRERGSLFLASSAGGVYGGAFGAPFDEESLTSPLGHYGIAKLSMEHAARDFSEATGVTTVVGRIANLYGPGQALSKPQGLISHLCRASVTRSPLSVFVPLDTLRDYIYVDDCAGMILDTCAFSRDEPVGFHVKVLASGRSVSIGALLGEFRRVIGRRPDIVMGSSPQSALQSRDLRLRSRYWASIDERQHTNLADGIARTLGDIRSSFLQPTVPAISPPKR